MRPSNESPPEHAKDTPNLERLLDWIEVPAESNLIELLFCLGWQELLRTDRPFASLLFHCFLALVLLADASSVTGNAGFGVCVRFRMVAFVLEFRVLYMALGKLAVQP